MSAIDIKGSSWGKDRQDLTRFQDEIGAKALLTSGRSIRLDQLESVYTGHAHDWKQHDWDGNYIGKGKTNPWQPALINVQPSEMIPWQVRRPCNPYKLGRMMVNAFTSLIFDSRFPEFKVLGDDDSKDFVNALAKAQRLPSQMIRARNLGGACGTVGLSWAYVNGRPRCRVHNAKHLYVHKWDDREELIPRHVTELFRYCEPRWNEEKKIVEDVWFWHRRDWTPDADIVFLPVRYDPEKEPEWVVDEECTNVHDHRFAHFVWIQNFPNSEIDGLADYEGVEENLIELDMLNSVMSKALRKNLDPTLVLTMEAAEAKLHEMVAANTGNTSGLVKKGSDWAIMLGQEGDAKYLEINGTGITVGLEKLKTDTKHVLDVAQCVITDPNEIAAQGLSGVAIRLVFGPMLKIGSVYRGQYGQGMERLLKMQLVVAQAGQVVRVFVHDDGTTEEIVEEIDLPPKEVEIDDEEQPPPEDKVETKPAFGDGAREDENQDEADEATDPEAVDEETPPDGEQPADPPVDDRDEDEKAIDKDAKTPPPIAGGKPVKKKKKLVEHTPGKGEHLETDWDEFFPDTPDDVNKKVTMLSTAAGGIAIISQQTAVEETAKALDRDPDEEWSRVHAAAAEAEQKQSDMMSQQMNAGGGPGGQVGAPDQLPIGSRPPKAKPPTVPGPGNQPPGGNPKPNFAGVGGGSKRPFPKKF